MARRKILGLSTLFLAISVFVSGSLVLTVRESYAENGVSPTISQALHLLQNT